MSVTYRPLREPELLQATALGQYSLLILQAAAHDAGSDGEVAVVAVAKKVRLALAVVFCGRSAFPSLSKLSPLLQPTLVCELPVERNWNCRKWNFTHVMPAAFHANVILAAIWEVVEVVTW